MRSGRKGVQCKLFAHMLFYSARLDYTILHYTVLYYTEHSEDLALLLESCLARGPEGSAAWFSELPK